MITSNFLLSVIRLNFVKAVKESGDANAVSASPPGLMISRSVILVHFSSSMSLFNIAHHV